MKSSYKIINIIRFMDIYESKEDINYNKNISTIDYNGHKLLSIKTKKRKWNDYYTKNNINLSDKNVNENTCPQFFVAGNLNFNMSHEEISNNIKYLFDELIKNKYLISGKEFDVRYQKESKYIYYDKQKKKKFKLVELDLTKLLGSIHIKKNSPNLDIIDASEYIIVQGEEGQNIEIEVVIDYNNKYGNSLDNKYLSPYPIIKNIPYCFMLEEYFESGKPIGYMTSLDEINELLDKYPSISNKIGYIDFYDNNILKINNKYIFTNTKLNCFVQYIPQILYNYNNLFSFNKNKEFNDFSKEDQNKINLIMGLDKPSWKYYYKSESIKFYDPDVIRYKLVQFIMRLGYNKKVYKRKTMYYNKNKSSNYNYWNNFDISNIYTTIRYKIDKWY